MRIDRGERSDGDLRRVQTAGGEFENRSNLLSRYMKLFDNFVDIRARLEVFKNGSDRHPCVFENPSAAPAVWHALHGGAL
jgi:hypothetical protein